MLITWSLVNSHADIVKFSCNSFGIGQLKKKIFTTHNTSTKFMSLAKIYTTRKKISTTHKASTKIFTTRKYIINLTCLSRTVCTHKTSVKLFKQVYVGYSDTCCVYTTNLM